MAGPYYTVPAAKENDPTLGNRVAQGLNQRGGLVYMDCEYVLLGTEAATEEIYICRNKPEHVLVDHLSAIVCENPGTALVVDVGDDADVDKYGDALVLSSGGTVLLSSVAGVNNQDPVVTLGDTAQGDWIKALVMTATSLTAGQKIRFKLVFATNT